jgi:hypothetical protein
LIRKNDSQKCSQKEQGEQKERRGKTRKGCIGRKAPERAREKNEGGPEGRKRGKEEDLEKEGRESA